MSFWNAVGKPNHLNRSIPFTPWIYFVLFLCAHTLISFAPLSTAIKCWIGILGLLLPLLVGIQTVWIETSLNNPAKLPLGEAFAIPAWLWVLFFALLAFSRFWRITTMPFWPISDEGITSFLSLRLSHHWNWKLLYTQIQVEPFAFWMLGLFFKVVEPSFFTFRLFSMLVSLATVGVSYWAALRFLPRSLAFLFAWLLAFSFWELTLMRLYIPVIWGPFFECLSFGFFGSWFRAESLKKKWINLLFLTLFSSMGFYVWINWVGVWIGLTGIIFVKCLTSKKEDQKQLIFFVGGTFLITLPLLLARFSAGGDTHIYQLLSFSIFHSIAFNGIGIFWNGYFSFPYGSNWGGFFNPILDALIFLGFIFLLRETSRRFFCSFVFCCFTAALPAILTNNIELYRCLLTFPLLTFLSIMGVYGLLLNPSRVRNLGGVFLFVIASFGLDFHNFVNHYCNNQIIPSEKKWRNLQYYDAYNLLSDLSRKEGPLYVFSEFNTDYDNKTLDVACYPFDALQNPSLSSTHPVWTAVITNVQYAPYFFQYFPGTRMNILKTDKNTPNDPKPFGIFFIPTSRFSSHMLEHWKMSNEIYREIDFNVKNKRSVDLWASFLNSNPSVQSLSSGDSFLSSVFWEKMGLYKFLDGYFIQASEAYQMAILQGIPAAHLYYDLGLCFKIQNKEKESKANFEKAEILSKLTNHFLSPTHKPS